MQEAALLKWYLTAGVDEAIQDMPRNYFVPEQKYPESTFLSAASLPPIRKLTEALENTVSSNPSLHHVPSAAMEQARLLADQAQTLAELEKAVRGFEGCAIKRTATNTVFADGNPKSRLMLIGEAPGAQEDIQGIPFCGASGQLLDKMMAAIGRNRTRFYITNTIFWRPPGNRQPSVEELAICKPFVEKHIALVDPYLIVLVGGTAAKGVLNTEQGITRLRGKTYTYRTPYRDKDYPVSIIYHPSYLLRQPAQKRVTWQDLLAIKSLMENLQGK